MLFRKNTFLILIFLLALFLRTWRLHLFPISIIHDELNYILNAKSLFYTGQNIPLTASSLLSWGEKNWDVVISEVPSVILAPWIGIMPLTQFNARLPFAFLGSFSVILLFLITKKLLGEKIAKITAVIFAFNPWSIHFSRMALEVSFASFFFLLGAYLFLTRRSWQIFVSFPFFILGFMSYLGAKLHFLPYILILVFYRIFWDKKEENLKPYLIFVFLSFLFLLTYFLTMGYHPAGARKGELVVFNSAWAGPIVDTERRQTIPSPALNFFSNKLSVTLKRVADTYLSGFSPRELFAKGDVISVYSLWQHGHFYYLDFFLIALGFAVLFASKRKVFWLVSLIILLGPIVSALDLVEETYSVRAFPMYPFLALLAAVGFWFIRENLGRWVYFLGIGLYGLLVLNFFYLYFYRYPIYAAERWFFSERLVAKYITLLKEKEPNLKIRVITGENPKNVYEEYLFYSGSYENKNDIEKANANLSQKIFGDENVIFTQNCSPQKGNENEVILADVRTGCFKEERGDLGFVSLADAGTVFVLKNDRLCPSFSLPRYYRPLNKSVFAVEKLNVKDFCENWVVKFRN